MIETTLKTLINQFIAGGCHNTINTTSPLVLPYVVFYEISGFPTNGITDYLGLTRFTFQVDVFAKSPEQAKVLATTTIKEAISDSTELQGTLTFQMNGQYSELDKTYQYITEYEIWAE